MNKVKLPKFNTDIEVEVPNIPVEVRLKWLDGYTKEFAESLSQSGIKEFKEIANIRKRVLEDLFQKSYLLSELNALTHYFQLKFGVLAKEDGSWMYGKEFEFLVGNLNGMIPTPPGTPVLGHPQEGYKERYPILGDVHQYHPK